ncbi:monovalent cation/H(+) antiporter subunit G [Marinihelvus fidelis]|uniref:Monovalent cation/H(+) antiporter subunit G n=1 Tax=Marinihelvus fidelis TaxID=2613842 RepID=A0A5N0T5G0_9GAMM|nr:monovalent cation/H(+) antiporter subunit G [Marinihelvus fidelis]KAA9130285.1 monovalent cation/H(+) antiporter subunit G [Marinihelvus fidelis]
MSIVEIVAYTLVFLGAFFCLVGAIGVLRFPDVYSRMHSAGITDTIGALLVLLGLAFLAGWTLALVKLAFILVFLWMTSPTATHALAKAARHGGVEPKLADDVAMDDFKETPSSNR